jgi:hypothetical protein
VERPTFRSSTIAVRPARAFRAIPFRESGGHNAALDVKLLDGVGLGAGAYLSRNSVDAQFQKLIEQIRALDMIKVREKVEAQRAATVAS